MKDLKIVLIKDVKSTLSRCLNKRQGSKKKVPYQRPKKVPYQRSKKCLIKLVWEYAFLLEASKTCDLSLIKKIDVQ